MGKAAHIRVIQYMGTLLQAHHPQAAGCAQLLISLESTEAVDVNQAIRRTPAFAQFFQGAHAEAGKGKHTTRLQHAIGLAEHRFEVRAPLHRERGEDQLHAVRFKRQTLCITRDELLGAQTLVTLRVADDADVARGRAVGERLDDDRRAVLGVEGDLRHDRDAHAEGDQGFDGGNLGAAEADLGLKVVVAEETLHLVRQAAAAAEEHEGFLRQIVERDVVFHRERVRLADDEQKRLGEERLHREARVFHREGDDGEVELAIEHAARELRS